jgi:hypothetical protein
LNYGTENCPNINVLKLPWPGMSKQFWSQRWKALGGSIFRGRFECDVGFDKGFIDALNYLYLEVALLF